MQRGIHMDWKKMQLKRHALTGISYMIPVVVAGGLCMGLAKVFGGWDIAAGTFAAILDQIGGAAIGFTVPVITAGIAYSIAGRPGIAPGLAIGTLANSMGAGFLGGLIGWFLTGYITLLIKKKIKLPQAMIGLMPVLVIPLLATLASGLIFVCILGSFVSMINGAITAFLLSMSDSSGLILGGLLGLMRIDMGGPCAQAAYAFSSSMIANGVYGPMSATLVSGMTPPVGVGLAVLIARKRFTGAEYQAAKTAIPLGLCFITEGVFPFVASDPVRTIISCTAGSAVSGALAVFFGCEMPIPHGGVFAIPFCNKPLMFILAFIIGCLVTALLLIVMKPKTASDADDIEQELTADIEFS